MTLSAISNAVLAKTHISQQKTDTETKQSEKDSSNPSSENTFSRNKFDDNVTLSQSQKANASSKVVDEKAAEKLLHQTKNSILAHSKPAVSAQATITQQIAQEYLAEN